jgi:dynein heavy chain
MNPGYAGRTELPESVKALFRPVVVIVPDLQQICEIMLFSEGFLTAKVLAKKMTVLYKLAKEQLSKQYHYDFGLRALKSVLVMAGDLKRGSPDLPEVCFIVFFLFCFCVYVCVNGLHFLQLLPLLGSCTLNS